MCQNSSSLDFMKTLQKEEEARLQKEKERLERERLQKEKEPNLQICDKDVNVCAENLESVIGPQQYTQNNKDTPFKEKVIENL